MQDEPVSSLFMQSKILRKKSTIEEYLVYCAGLEWDLSDPIVIEKREDLKSEYRWRDRLEPYNHQVTNLMTFCRRLPVTLLADDVGLGKTISAGLIISELISRSRVSKILIVCPKLLGPQWQEELGTKFDIPSEIAIGRTLIKADPDETGAVITTYNSARLHLESLPENRFEMLILDEAHKLRNLYGVEKPPQVAKCFRKALEKRRFRFVLMLTATPIQNRLWDLYSLVDLLTVARGHENPFGSEGMFARKFIADHREQARHLKQETRDEFRSIVYGYMSRVRRGDAKLYFPERVVQMYYVDPTSAEMELIRIIAKPIQKLNRLVQISILQALTSSPEALMAQLNNMARNSTIPQDLAFSVQATVNRMPKSAKLDGLGKLIEQLKKENPQKWRLVVFTGRLETQTTIQAFLTQHGLKVGIINGSSGSRNQETLHRFRKNPPDCHVIVSTEAGSEGINLQVANVLVNYDLPWNPMIVEQRIGRVQRLASDYANVSIFNIVLRKTFEEYIVGRLMEKLQMASHAIGDIEALLGGSGIGDDDENGATSFEERIRKLVIAALEGKDYETATKQTAQSIDEAKSALEREQNSINELLGGMDGVGYVGPRAPTLPSIQRSMAPPEFTLAAFETLGARITQKPQNMYLVEDNGGREHIYFEINDAASFSTLYAPGYPAFLRLVNRIIATGVHDVEDLDQNPVKESEIATAQWVLTFGGLLKTMEVVEIQRCFNGMALIRVRSTVAHDSYEKLIYVPCSQAEHISDIGRSGLEPLPYLIENPKALGINTEHLINAAKLDESISEFSRFYLERRSQEMNAAGGDERKRKKLEDEFTPRLEMTLVALKGRVHRQLKMRTSYQLDGESVYESELTVTPHTGKLLDAPEMGTCSKSGKTVPRSCLNKCQITGTIVLQHYLSRSQTSARLALPEHTILCSFSGKRILKDEAEVSAVSGRLVASSFLKTSSLSGKRAEPEFFGRCEFTRSEVLNTELAISEISGKRYRHDEQTRSAVSGKAGHRFEFIVCHETRQPLTKKEAEKCDMTGKYVRPGILETCVVTQKRVLPSELLRCAATGKKALKPFFVKSSLSEVPILEKVAVRSSTGKFCSPIESKPCLWSNRKCHPEDICTCELTGLPIHFEFASSSHSPRLQPLIELLNGIKRTANCPELWNTLETIVPDVIGNGRCRVNAAVLSPDNQHLAICADIRTLLGLRVRQVGFVYSLSDNNIVGRVAQGKRTSKGWLEVRK